MIYKPYYLAGRCWNGAHRDSGKITHAVEDGATFQKSLCGKYPGKRSYGWAEYSGEINCKKCLKKLRTNDDERII